MARRKFRVSRELITPKLIVDTTKPADGRPSRMWLWLPLIQVVWLAGGTVMDASLRRSMLVHLDTLVICTAIAIGLILFAWVEGRILAKVEPYRTVFEQVIIAGLCVLGVIAAVLAVCGGDADLADEWWLACWYYTVGIQIAYGSLRILIAAPDALARYRRAALAEIAESEGVPLYRRTEAIDEAAPGERRAAAAKHARAVIAKRDVDRSKLDGLVAWIATPVLAMLPATLLISLATQSIIPLFAFVVLGTIPCLVLLFIADRFRQTSNGGVSLLSLQLLAGLTAFCSLLHACYALARNSRHVDLEMAGEIIVISLVTGVGISLAWLVVAATIIAWRWLHHDSSGSWDEL